MIPPICENPACSNPVGQKKIGGWKKHCSTKCKAKCNSISGSAKRKQTCLKKFGHTTNLKSDETKSKIKETLMKKHGVTHQMQIQSVRDKIKNTNLERYGVENYGGSQEHRENMSRVMKDLLANTNLKEVRKESCVVKYGVSHFSMTDEWKQKFKETCIERFGVDNPSKSEVVANKIRATFKQNYKSGHPNREHISDEVIEKLNSKEWLVANKTKSVITLGIELGVYYGTILDYYHKHGIERDIKVMSQFETEIAAFVESLGLNTIRNSRKIIPPKEIDIFVPDANLGIEINGVFWHSDSSGKDHNYHIDKTRKMNANGFNLIHVLDSEVILKNQIVKSRIASILGKNEKIYARKCEIRKISYQESSEFLEENHIQGSTKSKINFGLFYQGDLYAVMTFGKPRFNKKYEWELIRYCSKVNYNIVGGSSKILKKFVTEYSPTSIISYSDKRWSIGNLYKTLGFAFSHTTKPGYHYTKNYLTLESRISYQKGKLSKVLEKFDESLSEWENMQANGYDRIWDCGNDVWVWVR